MECCFVAGIIIRIFFSFPVFLYVVSCFLAVHGNSLANEVGCDINIHEKASYREFFLRLLL